MYEYIWGLEITCESQSNPGIELMLDACDVHFGAHLIGVVDSEFLSSCLYLTYF